MRDSLRWLALVGYVAVRAELAEINAALGEVHATPENGSRTLEGSLLQQSKCGTSPFVLASVSGQGVAVYMDPNCISRLSAGVVIELQHRIVAVYACYM
jgi:hypothetical protein